MQNLKFAVYLAIALVPALVLHEYAHALVATRRRPELGVGEGSP